MSKRRANDAQVERLLHKLKTDLGYRQQLARRIAEQDNIKYDSAMRRLQRYITEGEEKRSFVAAPVAKRQFVREDYREYDRQERRHAVPRGGRDYDRWERDDIGGGGGGGGAGGGGAFGGYDVKNQDLVAIVAYHDGNIREAAYELGLSRRAERQLDALITSYEADAPINVLGSVDGVELAEAVRDFMGSLDGEQLGDLEAFHDGLLQGEMADWRIGTIIRDIESGRTTFSDWVDAALHDLDYPDDVSEWWELWREAYEAD